jgi:hypothetical protein
MLNIILKYGVKEKKFTVRAAIYMLIGTIFSIIPYFFLYRMIDSLLNKGEISWNQAFSYIGGIFVSLLLFGFLYILGLKNSHIAAYNILKNIRTSLQQKLEKKPLGSIQELGTGNLKKMFVDDIDSMELLLAHALPEGIANSLVPILLYIAIFIVDLRLGLLSLITLPIGIWAMGTMFSVGTKYMNDYYMARVKMNNTIIEYINGMEVVKVFNKDMDSYKKYREDVINYRDFTLFWYGLCWTWMALYTVVLPALALFMLPVGAWMCMIGILSPSKLILALCLSFAVGVPLLKAMSFMSVIPQLAKKIESLEQMMDLKPLKQGGNAFAAKNFDIDFKSVSFAYKDTNVLQDINLHIKEGTMTALVGESGSGKSTLAKLLVHFYDVNEGSISIGGQDITSIDPKELNNQISYVAQEQFLFNTSLYENIKIGKPSASKEEVMEAARKAQCMEFLERLEKGIDTMAGDGGKSLSGGERQRICLARAILKDAPIIVLDEATAFIDPENEDKLNLAISEIIKNKTVIVIAHRLSSIQSAGQICVLSEGKITACATHDELIKDCSEYKALWDKSNEIKNWKVNTGGVEYA